MEKIKELILKLFKYDPRSLKMQSMRSAVWSILGKGGGQFIRMAGNLVLTRILFPEAFGLMATANIVIMIIQYFADTGIKLAIIQNPRGNEPEFLNTSWIISIIRGAILCLTILILAIPISIFYKEPSLSSLLFIMAVSPLFLGFSNPALPLLIKKFRVEKQIGMELSAQLIALITTIVLAAILNSVYALAIGYSISAFYRMLASYIVIQYRPCFRWNKEAGRELFHFGKFIFINTIITAIASQLDIVLIGKMLDMKTLSFYNIGLNFGKLVIMLFIPIISQSYLPAVSSVLSDISRVERIYRRTTTFFLTVAIPVSIVLALFSHDIIRLLYDPRYQLAYISMFWIGLSGIFRIIGSIAGTTFIAVGRPALETASMAIGLLIVAVIVSVGINLGGLKGASCGMAIAFLLISLIESILLVWAMKFSPKIVFRPWIQSIATGGICIGIHSLLKPWLSSEQFYNIPFLLFMGLLFVGISGLVFRYLEGPNPFKDEVKN